MANIISAQNGNWADGTTWEGGVVPAQTDTATISTGHTVTVAANITHHQEIVIQGELSVASGVTLKMGDTTVAKTGTLSLQGGTLSGAGTVDMNNGIFQNASDEWGYVTIATLTSTAGNPGRTGIWTCRKIQFNGVQNIKFHVGNNGTAPHFTFEDCVMKECGTVIFLQSGWNYNVDLKLTKCSFIDNTGLNFQSQSKSTTVDKCLFYNTTGRTVKVNGTPLTTLKNSVILNTVFSLWSNIVVENCFFGGDSFVNGEGKIGGETSGATAIFNKNVLFASADVINTRMITHKNATNCYIEDNSPSGSNTFLGTTQCHWSYNVVKLFHSDGMTILPDVTGNPMDIDIHHNTLFNDNNFFMQERKTPSMDSPVIIKNNLFIAYRPQPEGKVVYFATSEAAATAGKEIDSDYNFANGLTGGWTHPDLTNTTGTHNTLEDNADYPAFVDSTRTVATWGQATIGGTTYRDVFDYLIGLNGYDETTSIHSGTALADTITTDIYTWIMEGYVPTNMALATASDTGSYVGALEPKSVVVVTADISLKANANTVTIGDNVTYTLTLSEVLPEDLLVTVTIGNVDRSTTISANALEGYITFTTATVGNLVAQIKNTDNGNVTIKGSVVNVVVNDVAPPPPQGKFFRPLEVATVDESHVNLTVPSGVTGELQITLTYTKG